MTKIHFIFLNNRQNDCWQNDCVVIASRATNQSREFSFFTYVIILMGNNSGADTNCISTRKIKVLYFFKI